jgi:hypothetical protein
VPWLKRAGSLLAFGFAAALVYRTSQKSEQFLVFISNPIAWLNILLFAICYGCSLSLIGLAWDKLLNKTAEKQMRKAIIQAFMASQINKYIPGNFFHFVSRHLIVRELDIPHKKIITSISLEIIGLVFSASLIGIFAASKIQSAYFSRLILVAVGAAMILSLAAIFYRKLFEEFHPLRIATAFILYAAFFLITGTIVAHAAINTELISIERPSFLFISFIAFSWVGGFITPGASGGIGIREGLMLFFGPQLFPHAAIEILAIMYRCITLLGDGWAYILSKIIERTTNRIQNHG